MRRITPTGICPICGNAYKQISLGRNHPRKQTCSRSCGNALILLRRREIVRRTTSTSTPLKNFSRTVWYPDMDEYLRKYYAENGAKYCATNLRLSISSIRCRAEKLGIYINQETKKRIVHGSAQKYMIENNPMRNKEIVDKVKQTQLADGSLDKFRIAGMKALSLIRRDKPSKVQLFLKDMMHIHGLDPEHEYVIKDKFVVDFAFLSTKVVVEVDGCYWHGHNCRFDNLTERQEKQKLRDLSRNKYLKKCGWEVIRLWECEINHSPVHCVERIQALINTH